MNDLMDLDQRLGHLQADSDRLATCAEVGDLTAAVAACPGWTMRELVGHVGFIHRWATVCVRTAAPPDRDAVAGADPEANPSELGAWLRSGSQDLIETLRATPPDADTWHPFPFERKVWIWSRRQMIETALHRWDGEVATTGMSDLSVDVAVVGIREFFELGLPRILARDSVDSVPSTSLHVHCTDDGLTDGAGEWIVWMQDGEYRAAPEHRKGDAALRGPAADVLLVLMGRAERSKLDIVGDPAAAAAWLDLPGW